MKNKSNKEQAKEYVFRVGKTVARQSVHYATAKTCECGKCFCCQVEKAVKN